MFGDGIFPVADLFIPIYLVLSGFLYLFYLPKRNAFFLGHNTRFSQSSDESWKYANNENGKIRFLLGSISLLISFITRISSDFNFFTIHESFIVPLVIFNCILVVFIFLLVEKKTKKYNLENKVYEKKDENRPSFLRNSVDRHKIKNQGISNEEIITKKKKNKKRK